MGSVKIYFRTFCGVDHGFHYIRGLRLVHITRTVDGKEVKEEVKVRKHMPTVTIRNVGFQLMPIAC
jgi:hypothetical protein